MSSAGSWEKALICTGRGLSLKAHHHSNPPTPTRPYLLIVPLSMGQAYSNHHTGQRARGQRVILGPLVQKSLSVNMLMSSMTPSTIIPFPSSFSSPGTSLPLLHPMICRAILTNGLFLQTLVASSAGHGRLNTLRNSKCHVHPPLSFYHTVCLYST